MFIASEIEVGGKHGWNDWVVLEMTVSVPGVKITAIGKIQAIPARAIGRKP
jgi:hypothetical protein